MSAGSTALAPARPLARVMGLGSVFGKTMRDSRRAALLVGIVGGLFMVATAAPYGVEFVTEAKRAAFVASMTSLPPVFQGLLGQPIHIETLGGFLSWRVGNILPVLLGLWSVIALSGTLAGEAASGSLDLVAATPHSRRSIALQKLGAHVVALAVAMLILAVSITVAGLAFGVLPGDEIPFPTALSHVALYGLLMLAAGSVSFATAPLVGRSRAMAFGFAALFGMYLIESFGSIAPALDALSPISWYSWTAGHRPMAGVTDWPSMALLAVVTVALLVAGVVAFERRDIGSSDALGWLRTPSLPGGVGGPFRRQLADRTGIALAGGVGIGLYAALIASVAPSFLDILKQSPGLLDLIRQVYPAIDLTQPSGLLQLAFAGFASMILGLLGAFFVAGWAGDEGRRRTDLVLTTPLRRTSWMIRSGLALYAAILIAAVTMAVLVALPIASQGADVVAPSVGILVIALAVMGLCGIGLAVGGLVRSSLAAPVAAFAVLATFVIDILGPALKLPDPIIQLSLYAHLGKPIAGSYDPVGIVIAAVLAVGGLLVAAWGLQRRDIGR
jgi:polyether ionophore transport system permease protein